MRNNTDNTDIIEHLVSVNRVAKVVKGGRRFGFAAIVVVGDAKGKVGYGTGKAKEVPNAIKKASTVAKKSLFRVPLKEVAQYIMILLVNMELEKWLSDQLNQELGL